MGNKFIDYTFRAPGAVVRSFEAMCKLSGKDPNDVLVQGLIKVFKLELDKVDSRDPEDLRVLPRGRRKPSPVAEVKAPAKPKKPAPKKKAARGAKKKVSHK